MSHGRHALSTTNQETTKALATSSFSRIPLCLDHSHSHVPLLIQLNCKWQNIYGKLIGTHHMQSHVCSHGNLEYDETTGSSCACEQTLFKNVITHVNLRYFHGGKRNSVHPTCTPVWLTPNTGPERQHPVTPLHQKATQHPAPSFHHIDIIPSIKCMHVRCSCLPVLSQIVLGIDRVTIKESPRVLR